MFQNKWILLDLRRPHLGQVKVKNELQEYTHPKFAILTGDKKRMTKGYQGQLKNRYMT
jgi:hypothetical protein